MKNILCLLFVGVSLLSSAQYDLKLISVSASFGGGGYPSVQYIQNDFIGLVPSHEEEITLNNTYWYSNKKAVYGGDIYFSLKNKKSRFGFRNGVGFRMMDNIRMSYYKSDIINNGTYEETLYDSQGNFLYDVYSTNSTSSSFYLNRVYLNVNSQAVYSFFPDKFLNLKAGAALRLTSSFNSYVEYYHRSGSSFKTLRDENGQRVGSISYYNNSNYERENYDVENSSAFAVYFPVIFEMNLTKKKNFAFYIEADLGMDFEFTKGLKTKYGSFIAGQGGFRFGK